VLNIGTCHMAGEYDVVENDQVDRRVIGLKIQGAGQRIGCREILERTVSIDGDLNGNGIDVAVNDPVRVITAELFFGQGRLAPAEQKGCKQQGRNRRGPPAGSEDMLKDLSQATFHLHNAVRPCPFKTGATRIAS
jgi:hypothetical protein